MSESALNKLKKLLEATLPEEYLDRPYGRAWAIRYTMFDAGQNPLLRIFCCKSVGRSSIGVLLQYLRVIGNSRKPMTARKISEFAGDEGIDERTLRSRLKRLQDYGYTQASGKKERVYSLAPDIFERLDETALQRLHIAVDFLISIISPASCGYFLFITLDQYLDSIGKQPEHHFPFTFLHSHIVLALDDDVLWTLLLAMHRGLAVSFKYEPDRKLESVVPLRTVTESLHGRRYLIGLDGGVSIFRLDRMRCVKLGSSHGLTRDEIDRLCQEHLCHSLFGIQARGEVLRHVRVAVKAEDALTIRAIETAFPDNAEIQQDGALAVIRLSVNDPVELKPWLRKYIDRIKVLPGEDGGDGFFTEWEDELREWRLMYGIVQ
jgi:hypothetical protein